MILLGLTGGIAAGKSAALEAFRRAGAEVLSTDAVVHELLAAAGEVPELLAERWGRGVLAEDGSVDRSAVAERVFGEPSELAWLESVLHPRVGARVAEWRDGLDAATGVAVVEVPLLFESGMDAFFDATVTVTAPAGERERRAAERGHPGVEAREARQLSEKEKADRATYVIMNDGTLEDLDRRVSDLVATIGSSGAATGEPDRG